MHLMVFRCFRVEAVESMSWNPLDSFLRPSFDPCLGLHTIFRELCQRGVRLFEPAHRMYKLGGNYGTALRAEDHDLKVT